jgi:hypothetical protein
LQKKDVEPVKSLPPGKYELAIEMKLQANPNEARPEIPYWTGQLKTSPVAFKITPGARQIDLKGFFAKTKNSDGPGVPIKITSNDELAKAFEQAKAIDSKKWQDRTVNQVDFSKEYLLLFMWWGSGQDKLSFKVGEENKKPIVIHEFSPGSTQDDRFHANLFAIPRDVNWRVEKK